MYIGNLKELVRFFYKYKNVLIVDEFEYYGI